MTYEVAPALAQSVRSNPEEFVNIVNIQTSPKFLVPYELFCLNEQFQNKAKKLRQGDYPSRNIKIY